MCRAIGSLEIVIVKEPTARCKWRLRVRRSSTVSSVLLCALLFSSMVSLTVRAEEKPSLSERETRLILLGTGGGPMIRQTRSEPASLLIVDGHRYLIDVGSGTVGRLKQVGFEPAMIDRIFLTHLHFDHTADLATFLGFNWISGARAQVEIFGPPGTKKLTDGARQYLETGEKLYASFLPAAPPLASTIITHDIDVDGSGQTVYQDDRLKVIAVQNTHYSATTPPRNQAVNWKSYAFRFETRDKVIVFTGDTGPSEAVTRLAHGADILVSEVIDIPTVISMIRKSTGATNQQLKPILEHQIKEHLVPEEVGRMASRAQVKRVVLTHIVPGLDGESGTSQYMTGVRKYYEGPVTLGRDLDEY